MNTNSIFRRHGGISDEGLPPATTTSSSSATSISSGNVGLAFALVLLAAVCGPIGASLPFILPRRITETNRFLAGSLGVAGGVLVFLSLTDILSEAQQDFRKTKLYNGPVHAVTVSLVLFFTGIILFMAIKMFVRKFTHKHQQNEKEEDIKDVEGDVEATNTRTSLIENNHLKGTATEIATTLALHNFPEGVILFTSTRQSSSLGIAVAIGLIFHKLPEGLIIALPYYAATKSSWKAFLLAVFGSSFFLLLGAILAYAVFSVYWDPFVSGFILSITSGILFWLGVSAILPLAGKLDRSGKSVSAGILMGVFVIALSQSILSYS